MFFDSPISSTPPASTSTTSSNSNLAGNLAPSNNNDMLADIFGFSSTGASPLTPSPAASQSLLFPVSPSPTTGSTGNLRVSGFTGMYEDRPKYILLKHMNGKGLRIDYQFIRDSGNSGSSTDSTGMKRSVVQLALQFKNETNPAKSITDIQCLPAIEGGSVEPFLHIVQLAPGQVESGVMAVHFTGDRAREVHFHIQHTEGKFPVVVEPPLGELLSPSLGVSLPQAESKQQSLTGFNESSEVLSVANSSATGGFSRMGLLVLSVCNLTLVNETDKRIIFAGKTSNGEDIIVSLHYENADEETEGDGNKELRIRLRVNCEDPILAKGVLMLLKKAFLAKI